MKIVFDNLLIPSVTAVVGFLWLLAYKHPRTFKALSAPIVLFSVCGVLVCFGFLLAWSFYDIQLAGYDDIWKPFSEVKEIDKIKAAVEGRVTEVGKSAIPFGVVALGVTFLLSFFLWISQMIHLERQGEDPKAKKKDDDAES